MFQFRILYYIMTNVIVRVAHVNVKHLCAIMVFPLNIRYQYRVQQVPMSPWNH
jgi:hypothetical protein